MFPHPDYDLTVDFGSRLERVQVKTSTYRVRNRFVVQLSTRGGNQSWNGTIKYLRPSRCDSLFAHVGDGRRWHIPLRTRGGESAVTLCGAKYAEFEVEPGDPLPARAVPRAATSG
jgi:hypothetical protein